MTIDLDQRITPESGLAFAQERFRLNTAQTEGLRAYLLGREIRGDLLLSAVYDGIAETMMKRQSQWTHLRPVDKTTKEKR